MNPKLDAIKELVVPIGVIAIIASMLIQLPPMLLDFLLITNLLFALILLVTSLYIAEPMKLSSLPSMLLLATLCRLALNISTTRLILANGEAGKTVEAFGNIVVGGNLVVGVVVFLVITLVQFIVVAKGGERVAEVAARFTLDALPGKQMSIDADLRAGLLDAETARTKRQELATESRFYGALDGAMKFVKGDAIAGIIVTIINIVGGLTVGVLMKNMEIGQALHQYTLLTIGDGLLSQIPSLLNSIAAGMVVTRVEGSEKSSLSKDLLSQIGQSSQVKLIIAGLALILGIMPGMPHIQLIMISALIAATTLKKKSLVEEVEEEEVSFQPKTPAVLTIELGHVSAQKLYEIATLSQEIDGLRQTIYDANGLVLARPELQAVIGDNFSFRLRMRGIVVFEETQMLDGRECLDSILKAVVKIVDQHRCEFIDDILTRRTLDYFDAQAPELVSAVIPAVISVTQLTEILKLLAREALSIRNFDLILQAIAEYGAKAPSERILLEEVRIALRRIICAKYISKDGVLRAVTVDPVLDLAFIQAERDGSPLDPECAQQIANYLKQFQQPVVLIVSRAARRLVYENLFLRGVNCFVMAFEEIANETKFEKIGNIELGNTQEMAMKLVA